MRNMMKRFLRWLRRDWWVPRQAIWPLPEGYCTYNKFRGMILDTGLSKEQAQTICDELNEKEQRGWPL